MTKKVNKIIEKTPLFFKHSASTTVFKLHSSGRVSWEEDGVESSTTYSPVHCNAFIEDRTWKLCNEDGSPLKKDVLTARKIKLGKQVFSVLDKTATTVTEQNVLGGGSYNCVIWALKLQERYGVNKLYLKPTTDNKAVIQKLQSVAKEVSTFSKGFKVELLKA